MHNSVAIIFLFFGILDSNAQILISEFMYQPKSGEGPGEWIEVYNNSNSSISLDSFWILDSEDSSQIRTNYSVEPLSFAVVVKSLYDFNNFYGNPSIVKIDMPFLRSLNNSEDCIVIKNKFHAATDSLCYKASDYCGSYNFSIERVSNIIKADNPQNWACAAGMDHSSPGKKNNLDCDYSDIFDFYPENKVFSPDGNNLRMFYAGPAHALLTVVIYNTGGIEVKRLYEAVPALPGTTYLWNGRDKNNRIAPMGLYFVRAEQNKNEKKSYKKFGVVLARELK
ncbi:MAG: lamin tail domain-containing protein [bacterium]